MESAGTVVIDDKQATVPSVDGSGLALCHLHDLMELVPASAVCWNQT